MFRPEGEFTYIPKPGNPNLRYKVAKVDGKSSVQVTQSPDGTQKVQVDNTQDDKVDTKFDLAVMNAENLIEPILRRVFQPYFTFIGYIESETGQHKGYYAHYDPIIKGTKTEYDFRAQNAHLGDDLINLLFPVVKTEKIVSLIGIDVNNPQRQAEIDAAERLICRNSIGILRFIFRTSTISAIELGAMELGYPEDWRPLVESRSVAPMFAKFIAHRFFTAKGGVASPAAINGGGEVQYRISSGFSTTQAANSKWLLGCKEWFKDVYKITNPLTEEQTEYEFVLVTNQRNIAREEKDATQQFIIDRLTERGANIPPREIWDSIHIYVDSGLYGQITEVIRNATDAYKEALTVWKDLTKKYESLKEPYRPYTLKK
jgi:hypothetical protein